MIIGNGFGTFQYRILRNNQSDHTKTTQKLSSGKRINSAADDAAGLAISEKMRAQIRGLNQAKRNTADTMSMIQVTDGGLEEVTDILQRMRELSVQTLNDTVVTSDRRALNEELIHLKEQINKISYDTEFNTINVYDEHMPVYQSFTGNRMLDNQLTVIAGVNDYLGIIVDGQRRDLYLDAGTYSAENFLDMLDDKLWAVDKYLIASISERNTLTLSAENYKSIDGVVGGAAGFFYEYHLGMGPGVVFGISDLSGRLDIISGSNNVFTFRIDDQAYTVNFKPTNPPAYAGNGYTAEDLVNIMQTQLNTQNAGVRVFMNGNQIALDAGNRIIDGFGGNMIKIDGITSILYDNAKHGRVSKTAGYIMGQVPISTLTIEAGINDTIAFYLDGDNSTRHVVTIDPKTYTSSYELGDAINSKLKESGIAANAIASGTHILLFSNTKGPGSQVEIDSTCNAYQSIFQYVQTQFPAVVTGYSSTAMIEGRYGINNTTTITEGVNDTLRINVDGTDKTIKLEAGDYTINELVNKMNENLVKQAANITASYSGSSKYQLILKHNNSGTGTIAVDTSSNAYKTLLCDTQYTAPRIVAGETKVLPPPEGSTQPGYEYTPAVMTGSKTISSLVIDEKNDELSFNVSGQNVSIKISHGTYSADTLKTELQNKINAHTDNVVVSTSGSRIIFTTVEKGSGEYFEAMSGTAYQDIFVGQYLSQPYSVSSSGSVTKSHITGRKAIYSNIVIDSSNKDLQFNYWENGTKRTINIELGEGTYLTRGDLITELNKHLESLPVTARTSYYDAITIECDNAGNQYYFSNASGGFVDQFLSVVRTYNPSSYKGRLTSDAKEMETYIVGRKDISAGVVINPGINDELTFDLSHNGLIKETVSITLTAEHYSAELLVGEINSKLADQGIDYVKAEYGTVNTGTTADDGNKLVLRYISDEEGSHVIDGVRGSSAYSLFYNASGEPVPTYTIGVVDLSGGINITAGENDVFSFDIDGEKNTIVLSEGVYTAEELLHEMNTQLENGNAMVTASYFEGRLKLSYKGLGFRTIDNIRGNARGTLFMKTEGRTEANNKHFQLGANENDDIILEPCCICNELLRINTVCLKNHKSAEKSLIRADYALNKVLEQRGRLGALQNRLEHTISNLNTSAENLQASESRIRDADIAKEVMKFTKQSILQQAATAMLAQANMTPQAVLELLR